MSDRENVIKGIDICLDRFRCGEDCPYYNTEKIGCMEQLREDALALLKEQEEEIENLRQTAQSMIEGIVVSTPMFHPCRSCQEYNCDFCQYKEVRRKSAKLE